MQRQRTIKRFPAIWRAFPLLAAAAICWFVPLRIPHSGQQPNSRTTNPTGSFRSSAAPSLPDFDWSRCRFAQPKAPGEEPLLVYSAAYVGHRCLSVGERDVIPATHLTAGRIPILLRLLKQWTTPSGGQTALRRTGCVSAAFGAETPADVAALQMAVVAHGALFSHAVLHVVVGSMRPYPFNVQRNAAMEPWNSVWHARDPLPWLSREHRKAAPAARPPDAVANATAQLQEYFAATDSRVHYPYGLWLPDEGPPVHDPSLWPQTCGAALHDPTTLPWVRALQVSKSRDLVGASGSESNHAGAFMAQYAGDAEDARSPPRPHLFIFDIDALPSGNADEFAAAADAGMHEARSSIHSHQQTITSDATSGPPCIAGTTPLLAVMVFAPRPGDNTSAASAARLFAELTSGISASDQGRLPQRKRWLVPEVAGQNVVMFVEQDRRAYLGAVNMSHWFQPSGLLPPSFPVRYAPLYEPYFIGRVPLPPFDELYRGRGRDKGSYYFAHMRCSRMSLHALRDPFLLSDISRDAYRSADGTTIPALTARRPANVAHIAATLRRLGMRYQCDPDVGADTVQVLPEAECWFAEHPEPAMIGRGTDRPPTLLREGLARAAAEAALLWEA